MTKIKDKFLQLYFDARLIKSLAVFLLQLTFSAFIVSLKQRRSFLVSTIIVGLMIGSLTLKIIIFNQITAAPELQTVQQQHSDLLEEKFLTSTQVRDEIEKQKAVLTAQPTHFEALYNTSVLYSFLGNQELANQYLNQAKIIKPNSPLFN